MDGALTLGLLLLAAAALSVPSGAARAAGAALMAAAGLWFLLHGRRHNPRWPELEGYRYAHRGLHRKPEIPENSLSAFRLAAQRGYGAELDVHLTRDGRLAVIHDASLRRTCGAEGTVESFTADELRRRFRLEGTDEPIPFLEEVVPLFQGRGPLIVELKAEGGNHAALCARTVECLDRFAVPYCLESFDPRCLVWLRRHRPEIVRGQLAENFIRTRAGLPAPLRPVLTNVFCNCASRPDFVAYRFEDRRHWAVRLLSALGAVREADWTIRSPGDLETAEREGHLVIFEQFEPGQGRSPGREREANEA
jgi:glycerophosphoryl diester phosphodiesterase